MSLLNNQSAIGQENKMKLILLTGFLGAGKTTLLKRLLKEYDDTKIGVLMNEFGETSIDGQLIHNEDFDLIELTNGSIFCACLKENFIKGLAEFLNRDLEIVFVESSGVADPSNMDIILETVTKISGAAYHYAGSICIVDALYFLRQFEIIPALEKQLYYANEVIINKTDLQTPEILAEIDQKIGTINPDIKPYHTSFCQVPIRAMVSGLKTKKMALQDSTNTWESRPKTSVLKTKEVLDYEKFNTFIQAIKFSTHRIKGFVQTTQGVFEVSCVNDFAVMNPWHQPIKETEVVFISAVGIRMTSDLLRCWKDSFGDLPIQI
ncbi:CobW family GTP-binding protein [Acetobacterium woodii]|uniref:Cobalamin synthesis protein/P47K family protein n=1 Tax=Acetobacterium woodii (strain ATCC 29683 / DSM 1030 / JCM 2381 / KCTC 1655 / WB1) TaxID=931626 RepID=H6LIY9_ACEWD|nr:CobW family GTP-binding protein [Acetobacterium woodii]AFA47352.1 cobalamin synthesis protein/P47K family protein [Acetobacterium woodii DSM 1030]